MRLVRLLSLTGSLLLPGVVLAQDVSPPFCTRHSPGGPVDGPRTGAEQ